VNEYGALIGDNFLVTALILVIQSLTCSWNDSLKLLY